MATNDRAPELEPSFITVQFVTLPSGQIEAGLSTRHLLGADRTPRGRARVRLGLRDTDLLGLGPRARYRTLLRDLLSHLEANGAPLDGL